MNRSRLFATAIALSVAAASPTFAHEAAKGANGGLRVDAGKYHTELVANGSTTVVVFLSDAADKPVPAAGFKATAILVVDGKPQRFSLEPADGARLVGTSPVVVAVDVKGVIQLTAPDGTTAQGKY